MVRVQFFQNERYILGGSSGGARHSRHVLARELIFLDAWLRDASFCLQSLRHRLGEPFPGVTQGHSVASHLQFLRDSLLCLPYLLSFLFIFVIFMDSEVLYKHFLCSRMYLHFFALIYTPKIWARPILG